MALSPADSFVNSQEWTLSRSVPELKVVSEAALGLGGIELRVVALVIAPYFRSPLLPTMPLPAARPPGPLSCPQHCPFSIMLFAFPALSSPAPFAHCSPLPLPQGIVGNLSSGKSALVHRYLTGTYVQEESPEGESYRLATRPSPFCLCRGVVSPSSCSVFLSPLLEAVGFFLLGPLGLTVRFVLGGRFKKEIVVDGQSYLLLIRDEGGPPELQVRLLPSPGPLRVWGGVWSSPVTR